MDTSNLSLEQKIERCKNDFIYWAETCCTIKHKTTGRDVPFILNTPQRRLVGELERQRLAGKPVRLIMLKSRQWGGSTLVQTYMAWIQLCHCVNWNSIICSQVKDTSASIRGMYTKLLDNYPVELWDGSEEGGPKFRPFERSQNVREIAGRGCRVTISSIENQDSVRGSDFAMAHLSEVAFWRSTPSHSPEDLVRSVCSSIALVPNSLIVMESTANGVGNYFHREWLRCKNGDGDKTPFFVPWYEIDIYRMDVDDPASFEASLSPYEIMLRDVHKCSLEQINWYRKKLREYPSQAYMMAEFPTTDMEAFVNTGTGLFAPEHVEKMRLECHDPEAVGEINRDGGIRFIDDKAGRLKVWQHPADEGDYIVTVDIGGLTDRADWSVIAVMRIDRGAPEVVAQWRGHIAHDILVDIACNIGTYYNEALMVVESNTLEHVGAGMYILENLMNVYSHVYKRPSAKVGFHTNAATKEMIITGLMGAVREGRYIERDSDACDEMLSFEQAPDGSYSAKQGAHDDIIMTRAIALYVAASLPPRGVLPLPPTRAMRRRAARLR